MTLTSFKRRIEFSLLLLKCEMMFSDTKRKRNPLLLSSKLFFLLISWVFLASFISPPAAPPAASQRGLPLRSGGPRRCRQPRIRRRPVAVIRFERVELFLWAIKTRIELGFFFTHHHQVIAVAAAPFFFGVVGVIPHLFPLPLPARPRPWPRPPPPPAAELLLGRPRPRLLRVGRPPRGGLFADLGGGLLRGGNRTAKKVDWKYKKRNVLFSFFLFLPSPVLLCSFILVVLLLVSLPRGVSVRAAL